ISIQFVTRWKQRIVEYGEICIKITEDFITEVTGAKLRRDRFFNKRVEKNIEAKKFLADGENLESVMTGIKVTSIPEPFDEIERMIV
ncbi:hypothetical protein KI387_031185, partial [Taxus chinensis]